MIDGRKTLAVIPARGGSVGIPRKNLAPLAGKPLIAWTIEAALASESVDRVVVSSDDMEILRVAQKFGAEPLRRPATLARDDTPGLDPIVHAVAEVGQEFSVIACLQPTSPLRRSQHIDEAAALMVDAAADSCVSVCPVSKPPHWMYRRAKDGSIERAFPQLPLATRRQDAAELFVLNGAIYLVNKELLLQERQLLAGNCVGYCMRHEDSVDIDSETDLRFAGFLMQASTQRAEE